MLEIQLKEVTVKISIKILVTQGNFQKKSLNHM